MKKSKKKQSQELQVFEPLPVQGEPGRQILPGKVPYIRNVRTARRLLSKLIAGFVRGSIDSEAARTLTYIVSEYCKITRDADFEERLAELETRLKLKK